MIDRLAVCSGSLGGNELIENALLALPSNPSGVVIVILILAFLLGFFLDWIEITLIILPLIAPVLVSLDVNLVWFAVMFAVCLQTSFITLPVRVALFYMKGIAPKGVDIQMVYKGVIPFIFIKPVGVFLVFTFPEIVIWLPKVSYDS